MEYEEMKYMITWEIREPAEENMKKAREIESERRKKGETWTEDDYVLSTHVILTGPTGLQIVDTDDSKLAKWVAAYSPVYKIKISPIIERSEWQEARK